jgi:predicted amidohydrolase
MKETGVVSRRKFMARASAGAGLVAAGGSGLEAQATKPAEVRRARLPREVWVASIDLKDLYPETSVERRVERTLERMENLVAFHPDIVCLPETFNTSWVRTGKPLAEVAEEVPGPLVKRIGEYAKANGCYVICPIPTKSQGKIYNSAVLLNRTGAVGGVFHKVHPTEGEMNDGVWPGPLEPPVWQTDFGKIGVQICYDANWFPSWRALKAAGAEIVFFPSQFPGGRILTTHAWMNQFYIVSSTGEDARVIDISGDDLASSGPFERWVAAPINLEKALVHIWPEVQKFADIRKKYGRRVRIKIWHPENWATIESVDPEIKIAGLLQEFGLPTYEQHISKADGAQKAKRS